MIQLAHKKNQRPSRYIPYIGNNITPSKILVSPTDRQFVSPEKVTDTRLIHNFAQHRDHLNIS
jgi:hypothetical protein